MPPENQDPSVLPQPQAPQPSPPNPPQPEGLTNAQPQPAVPSMQEAETLGQAALASSPSEPQPQPNIGNLPQVEDNPKKSLLKNKFLLGGIVGLIAAIIAGGAYVAFAYLPNTPTNVYRRGLASVGVGLEEVLNKNFEEQNKNTNFKGSLDVSEPVVVKASMDGSYAVDGQSQLKMDVEYDGYKPSAELRVLTQADALPVMYFKLDNSSRLLTDYLGFILTPTQIGEVNGNWWSLDFQELVDLGGLSESEVEDILGQGQQLSQEDYEKLSTAVLEAVNEYVFTADTDKMVLELNESLGKEDYEGVESQKYKVSLNKENMKSFIKAIRDNVEATGLRDKLQIDKPLNEELTDTDIDSFVDEDINTDDVRMEAWVALDSKVLRNLRFIPVNEDGSDDSVYVDVSILLEENSSKIPVRLLVAGDDDDAVGDMSVSMVLDTESSTIEMSMDMDLDFKQQGADDFKMAMNMTLEGTAEAPLLTVPENSRSVIDYALSELQTSQAQAQPQLFDDTYYLDDPSFQQL